MTVRAAKNLERLGCVKGKKLFVLIGNVPELAPLLFGAICLGCTIVSIAAVSTQAECEYFLNLTKPEFAVCHVKSYAMLRKCFGNLAIVAKIITVFGQIEDSIPIQSLFDRSGDHDDNDGHFEYDSIVSNA